MFERVCLIHYHEIGLKGRNRSAFERRLGDNLKAALTGMPVEPVQRIASRLVVRLTDATAAEDVAQRIALVPGVNSVSVGYRTARTAAEMERAALLALRECAPFETFAVDARRSATDWPESSMEMNRRIGDVLRIESGARVDLTDPDVTVRVEVVQGDVYVYSRRIRGVGGLPVGTAGKVVALLSSGIDSPVASWRLMRRGAVVVGVHFSGRPHTSDASERLVTEIGHVLERSGGLGRIWVVPFGELQKEIALASPPDLRVLLYRRLMVRVAEAIARLERAKALVTGESLGQVASQTLENIVAVDDAATLPVLRPLIGSDKLEIIAEAKRLGTYEISTQEHADCCTLFMPRTPETHAKLSAVLDAEGGFDSDDMVSRALGSLTWMDFACLSYRPPSQARLQAEGVSSENPSPSS